MDLNELGDDAPWKALILLELMSSVGSSRGTP
jgi:hypothetical protein